jgi:transcriptional regulator with XRE-family HTH domain
MRRSTDAIPDHPLRELGLVIREARELRKLTQHAAAKQAGVSRRQWALLEAGGNVTIRFLMRIATFLDLRTIPLSGSVAISRDRNDYNAFDLLGVADEFEVLVERLRQFALGSVLGALDRTGMDATEAVRKFVRSHGELDAEELKKVDHALRQAASDRSRVAPAVEDLGAAPRERVSRRRRKA